MYEYCSSSSSSSNISLDLPNQSLDWYRNSKQPLATGRVGRRGHVPRAALCKQQHLEVQIWNSEIWLLLTKWHLHCRTGSAGSLVLQLMQLRSHCRAWKWDWRFCRQRLYLLLAANIHSQRWNSYWRISGQLWRKADSFHSKTNSWADWLHQSYWKFCSCESVHTAQFWFSGYYWYKQCFVPFPDKVLGVRYYIASLDSRLSCD